MSRYIRSKDGKFNGSVGDGKTALPTVADTPRATLTDPAPSNNGDGVTSTYRAYAARTEMLTRVDIRMRSVKYRARLLFDGCLTPHERELLTAAAETSCGRNGLKTDREMLDRSLDIASTHPHIGAVVRSIYFTDNGDLRPDVNGPASYTVQTLHMNVTAAQLAMTHPHWQEYAAYIHGQTEYVNDRISAETGWGIEYPNGGTFPDIYHGDPEYGIPGSLSVSDTRFPDVPYPAPGADQMQEAVNIGMNGPNAG